jgi:hypothetical protein
VFLPNDYLTEYNDYDESFEEFSPRPKKFLEYLNSQKIDSACICTHGGVMAGLKHFIQEGKFELDALPDFPHPGVLWILEDKKLEEINFNK